MTDGTRALETDPSVCYRHPGRQSWVLCQRCGRTVCPECQIMAPVGVHCPECVAETSGGVQWRPTNVAPLKPKRRRAARSAGRARSMLAGGARATSGGAARTILYAAVALYVLGAVTGLTGAGNVVYIWLSAQPGLGWQLWRFLTAPLSDPGGLDLSILFFALSAVFWWLTAPQVESLIGRSRFLAVVATASVVGSAGMLLSGVPSSGLTAPLFGVFAALLIEVWPDPRVRTQILVITAINLLIALTGNSLPELVGGMVGGGGALYLLRSGPERGWKPRTPALIIGAVGAVLVVLAILRGGVTV